LPRRSSGRKLAANQEHATDGRSWPIAAYREHQIKMIRLLPDCPTLIAYSQISDKFCCSQFLLVVRVPFVRKRRRTGQPVADDVLISATTYLLKLTWLVRNDSETNHHEKVLVHLRTAVR
jgi:hypothetical protein